MPCGVSSYLYVCPELTAAMSASQNRIAETVELFYTADKASDVRGVTWECGLEIQ